MATTLTAPTPIQSIASPQVAAAYYEVPFIYSKLITQIYTDSAPPTGATGGYVDVVKSDGDSDFFCRRALNVLNFNDMNQQAFISSNQPNAALGSFLGLDMPLAPEKMFALGADIQYLLQQTNGLINTSVAFLTYPGTPNVRVNVALPTFQGVKRFQGSSANNPGYKFYEKEFWYVLKFAQNWTFLQTPYTALQPQPFRRFIKTVLNWDFELQSIGFSADWNNNNTGLSSYNGYLVRLYDSNGIAVMKDYVHYRNLSYNGGYSGAIAANTPGNNLAFVPNAFPVPPILYPRGSNIIVDIISLLDTSATGGTSSISQTIDFRGVNRMPC